MNTKNKKKLILLALYDKKYDGQLYDIVNLTKDHFQISIEEAYQITKSLEDGGYVKMFSTKSNVDAEITANGVEFVEDEKWYDKSSPQYNPEDKIDPLEQEILKVKLDELSEQLSRIELGQQITYDDLLDEINDLKNLLGLLGKKHWTQILKGKLVDAGLGSISGKVLELMIQTFSNEKLLN